MNRLITFAAVLAVLSGALFAQDSVTTVAEPITNRLFDFHYSTNAAISRAVLSVDGVVKQLREQGDMTNLVKKLVASGDVCAVVGHAWRSDVPSFTTLEYRPPGYEYPEHRKCALCGKTQTKEPGVWK